MSNRLEIIHERFSHAVSNEATIGPAAIKSIAIECCHGLFDELDILTAAIRALQKDEVRYLCEGGDAIVDAKSRVRKRWMKITGLTQEELQSIAPIKPGHEI
jgi:hypothetical protein